MYTKTPKIIIGDTSTAIHVLKHHPMKSWKQRFMHYSTKWRRVASFMLQLLYLYEENPRCLLDKGLGWLLSRSGRSGAKDRNPVPAENRTIAMLPVSSHFGDLSIATIRTSSDHTEWCHTFF
jgi:hypothetical protein